MKFSRANKLVRGMMRGSRRDTLLLFAVIALVVLFMVASTIYIDSLDRTEDERREEMYGSWQTMFYAADDTTLGKMLEVAPDTVKAEFVGEHSDIGTVAAASNDWLERGSIALREGEFPTEPGEIALVASALTEDVKVGDKLTVTYTYNSVYQYESGGGKDTRPIILDYLEIDDEVINNAIDYLMKYQCFNWSTGTSPLADMTEAERAETFEEYRELFNSFNESTQSWWIVGAVRNVGQFDENGNYNDRYWFTQHDDPWETAGGITRHVSTYGYEGTTLRLNSHSTKTVLRGSGFGEDVGKVIEGEDYDDQLTAIREYTVTGIVEPYAELWDVEDLRLPDAFVAEGEADHMRAAIETVREGEEGMNEYFPQYILLSRDETLTAGELYEKQLPVYTNDGAGRFVLNVEEIGDNVNGFFSGEVADDAPQEYIDSGAIRPYVSFSTSYDLINTSSYLGSGFVYSNAYFTFREVRNGEAIERLEPYFVAPYPADYLSADYAYGTQAGEIFRLNSFAYPLTAATATGAMSEVMSVAIYIVAFFAVFQIYLAQSRRRGRRSSVMKSVGATGGQVFAINLLEGGYIILGALPLGVALGLGAAYAACRLSGDMIFTAEPKSIALGVLGCVASVGVGMLLTGAFTARTALGRERPQREQKPRGRARRTGMFRKMLRITGLKKTAALVLLVALMGGSLILSVFLGNNAYAGYRTDIESVNAPDYSMTLSYGLANRYIEETTALFTENGSISDLLIYPVARDVGIVLDDHAKTDPVIADLVEKSGGGDDEEDEELVGAVKTIFDRTALVTDVYGMDFESEDTIAKLSSSIAEGSIDASAIANGSACILVLPRVDDKLNLSASPQDAYFYQPRQGGYAVGDSITLVSEQPTRRGDGIAIETHEATARVCAVIYSTDLYPFSARTDAVTVIGGEQLTRALYPLSGRKMSAEDVATYESFALGVSGESYGRTEIYGYAAGSDTDGDVTAFRGARSIGAEMLNHHPSNVKRYAEATNGMIMIAALCVMIGTIVYAIYINIASSAVDGESHHIGVLHAVGAPRGKQIACYALYALMVGVIAEVAANLLVAAVALVIALVQGGGAFSFDYFTGVVLFGYPWALHIALVLLTTVLCVGAYFKAALRVCRRTPLDNIRS